MKKHFIIFSFVLCFSVLTVSYGHGKDGDSDTSFGTGGKAITAIGSGDDGAMSVAIQLDGKIVVAGTSDNGSNYDIAVVRYNINGSLDTAFGSGGKVTTAIGNGDDTASSLAIQADGKIVVAGRSYNGSNNDIALIRYNSNGSLDTAFGTGGKVTTAIGYGIDLAYAVAIQTDGKIVVAGGSNNASNEDFALVRYNSNGSLDTTFGTGGKVTTAIGNGDDEASGLAIQADGKIVVVGGFKNGSNWNSVLARYNSNGSMDTTFGTGGKVTAAIGNGGDFANAVAIQPDGKIVAAGYSNNGSNDDIALLRINSNGSPDTTFGTGGKVLTPVSVNGNDGAFAMRLQPDGKIVVTGYSGYIENVSKQNIPVVRYNSNGSLDTAFGTDGKVTTAIGSGDSSGNAIAIQSDGKIIVAGESQYDGSDWDFAVMRYDNFRNPCISVGNDLALNVCVSYQNTQYGFVMNFYPNPNDSSGLYWKMNIPSVKTLPENSLSCFQAGNDLALNICAEYQGKKYGFKLDFFPNSDDPYGLYWKMNLNTVTQQ